MKKKICIVIDHLGWGGAQRQLVEYLRAADRNQFDFMVVSLEAGNNIVKHEIEELGITVFNIDHMGFINLRTFFLLKKYFREMKPDLVHTYLFTADCYGRLAARMARVRTVVSSVRGIELEPKFLHTLANRLLGRITDKIVINAETSRSFVVRRDWVGSKKIVTIHNGIDLARFDKLESSEAVKKHLGLSSDALVVGMVARLDEDKDFQTLFEAARLVSERNKNAYFVVVGDGPLKESLKSQASSLKSENRIIFTGYRKDVSSIINAMDIAVLSTHHEGCPNAIMEYMACSKPVIATNAGGCPELVVDDITGFLIPKANPQVLADKILILLKDKELRFKMGVEGYRRVEANFSSEKMAWNTERLYLELINADGRESKTDCRR